MELGLFENFRTIAILVIRTVRNIFILAVFLLSAAVLPGHELETTVSFAAPAVVVRAAYGGSEPVSFAKVSIYSPVESAQQFQSGLTDRRGYFSFVPDQAGLWKVIVDDEEGHRRELSVPVPDRFESAAPSGSVQPSRIERALLGIALILGITGVAYGVRARRRS